MPEHPDAATPPSGSVATPERMELLHVLVFTAVRLCVAQLDEFTARLIDALAGNTGDVPACRLAREQLSRHRAAFQRLAADSLRQALLQAVTQLGGTGAGDAKAASGDGAPQSFEAVERQALVERLGRELDGLNGDALTALSLRISHWMAIDGFDNADNPFRSAILLNAVSEAWHRFDAEEATRRCVLAQLGPSVFLRLQPVLQALNNEMVARGVLPDVEKGFRQRIADADPEPPPSLAGRLRGWLALQAATDPAGTRVPLLLESMCAQVLDDETIPPPARRMLARLQEPLIRLARADAGFFFEPDHPLRRLLQSLIGVGLGCDPARAGEDGPLTLIAQMVERICAMPAQPRSTLLAMRDELEAFMASRDGSHGSALADGIAEARRQESRSHAQGLAENEIAARLETGEVDAFIESFLLTQWQRVLTFGFSVRDNRPDVLPKLLQAMDELVWSVKPKIGGAERAELIRRLPSLLAMLNAWLNVIKWQGSERESFFSALAARHSSALRAPAELSSRHRLEMRMDAIQRASEHQLARRERETRMMAAAAFMPLVDRLVPGSWVELVRNDGSRVNCRLLWVSPTRNRFVFVASSGGRIFPLADEALAQALHAGRASLIGPGAILGRALSAALDKLGAA